MGNYVFAPGPLIEELRADSDRQSHHDFGRNILPSMLKSQQRVFADFGLNRIRGVSDEVENAYWRDVGTVDAYFDANMDLKNVVPSLNLTTGTGRSSPPTTQIPRQVGVRRRHPARRRAAVGPVRRVHRRGRLRQGLGARRNVFVDSGARVEASVLFDNVYVGRGARVQKAIIDKNVRIPDGDHIGHDLARDSLRYTVSEGGTVVQKAKDTLLTRSRNF